MISTMVNGDEEVLALATSFPVHVQTLGIAEALGLCRAVTLVVDLGFRPVSFDKNCLQLFQWWRRRSRGSFYLDLLMPNCHFISMSVDHIELLFAR